MRNVDADKLLEEFDEYEPGEDFEYEHDLWLDLRLAVINAPAADVAPVVHGEWVKHPTFNYTICTMCDQGSPCDIDGSEWHSKYCPNCGAKMDGERNVSEANVGKMTNWKLTDVDESGYEYECPHCFCHIGARVKGRDLPEECPNCGADMRERKGDDEP